MSSTPFKVRIQEIKEREERAKSSQEYDNSPPRCGTCVFRVVAPKRTDIPFDPVKNVKVDKCGFGNFIVRAYGVCNEWRSKEGERLD